MNQISLLYHDVIPTDWNSAASGFAGADADTYKLAEPNFSAHLEEIAAIAAVQVQLVEKTGIFKDGSPPVLFTFDDGGITADQPTARLLEACGWRGHFFVVTSRIGEPGFLTRDQILDMHRRGHNIGSHSHSHPARISALSYEQILQEWNESYRILSDILGEPPFTVSVPGGFYSEEVARAAHAAGYKVLFNSEPNWRPIIRDGLVILGRFGIKRKTPASAALALARGEFAPRAIQALAWNAKKPLKKIGGKMWLSFRRWFFKHVF